MLQMTVEWTEGLPLCTIGFHCFYYFCIIHAGFHKVYSSTSLEPSCGCN